MYIFFRSLIFSFFLFSKFLYFSVFFGCVFGGCGGTFKKSYSDFFWPFSIPVHRPQTLILRYNSAEGRGKRKREKVKRVMVKRVMVKRVMVKRVMVKRVMVKRVMVKRVMVKRVMVKRVMVKRVMVKRVMVKRVMGVGSWSSDVIAPNGAPMRLTAQGFGSVFIFESLTFLSVGIYCKVSILFIFLPMFSNFNTLVMSSHTKKEIWGQIINIIVAVLSAVATTLGLNSCM